MRKIQIVPALLMLCIFYSACNKRLNLQSTQKGILWLRVYSPDSNRYVSIPELPPIRFWCLDSSVIQELLSPTIDTKINHETVTKSVTISRTTYKFLDLQAKGFYNYSSFSDTAKCIGQGKIVDTTDLDEGWSFYTTRQARYTEPHLLLTDTLIDKVHYKRMKTTSIENSSRIEQVAYFRCDKKGTMFQTEKLLGDSFGCPITRLDVLPSLKYPYPLSLEVEFLSDKLSSQELKVFAAWKKNAKQNPVEK